MHGKTMNLEGHFKKLWALMDCAALERGLSPESRKHTAGEVVVSFKDGTWVVETISSRLEGDSAADDDNTIFGWGKGKNLEEAILKFEKSLEDTICDRPLS